jgi:hypothetical protein
MSATKLNEARALTERWAHHVDGIDADSGRARITERRVLVHVIRDHVGVLLTNEAGKPGVMRERGYRPAVMWAAADLGVRLKMCRAEEFARRVCEFLGVEQLDDAADLYADEARRAAKLGLTRRA